MAAIKFWPPAFDWTVCRDPNQHGTGAAHGTRSGFFLRRADAVAVRDYNDGSELLYDGSSYNHLAACWLLALFR